MEKIEIRRQFMATLCANLLSLSFGTSASWASANYLVLQTPASRLDNGALLPEEASLLISLTCVGGLLGNMSFLWVVEKFGRKIPLLALAIPQIVSLLLIAFTDKLYCLYISRIMCGYVGGACIVCVPIFVIEISYDNYRGTLSSFFLFASNFGSLIQFTLALHFNYKEQALILLIFPTLFVIVFAFVPETPSYLQRRGDDELAAVSLNFYKGATHLPEMAKLTKEKSEKRKLTLEAFKGRAACRALTISIFLIVLNQFCGCYALLSYTTKVFEEAGASLSPIESSVLIVGVQLSANILTIYLVDRVGRKILFIASSLGTAVGITCLGLHNLYRDQLDDFRWIPIASLSFAIFIASLGLLSLPYTIAIDILPAKIRNVTLAFCSSSIWTLGFVINMAYPILSNYWGMHICMFIFATFCTINAIFCLIWVPETKGKSLKAIQRILAK